MDPTLYSKPTLERIGTVRDLTRSGGCLAMADAANPYHRYDPAGGGCGFPNG